MTSLLELAQYLGSLIAGGAISCCNRLIANTQIDLQSVWLLQVSYSYLLIGLTLCVCRKSLEMVSLDIFVNTVISYAYFCLTVQHIDFY